MTVDQRLLSAYKEATGAAQVEERQGVVGAGPTFLRPFKAALYDFQHPARVDDRRIEVGEVELSRIIRERPGGIFPLSDLYYDISGDYDRQGFSYVLTFPGERVGESGYVALPHFLEKPTYFRRGEQPLVEVGEKGWHILHLPKEYSIPVRVNFSGIWGSVERVVVANWRPELTNQPQAFSNPQGRGLIWNTPIGW